MSSQVQKQTLIYDLSAHILPYIGRKWPSLLAQKVGKTHIRNISQTGTQSQIKHVPEASGCFSESQF